MLNACNSTLPLEKNQYLTHPHKKETKRHVAETCIFRNYQLYKVQFKYNRLICFLYVCMVNTIYLLSFVETPRKFIIAELSIRKLGSSSVLIIRIINNMYILVLIICILLVLIICIISTDEDPSLRIESSAIINLRGVSTKLNKYRLICTKTNEDGAKILLHMHPHPQRNRRPCRPNTIYPN